MAFFEGSLSLQSRAACRFIGLIRSLKAAAQPRFRRCAMKLPDTAICVAAMDLAREHSPAFLFNHVMRSFAFGHSAGLSQRAKYDVEMLFLGSVLHDLGLV